MLYRMRSVKNKSKTHTTPEINKLTKKKYDDKNMANPTIDEPEIAYIQRTNKTVDDSWDFRKANTKEFTHCFHNYPAMMIPQIARRLIKNFGNKSELLFDPYCGTGTSLVEAKMKGINSIGTDINPLARLIASAKTTPVDLQVLDLFLQDFINFFFSISFDLGRAKTAVIPKVTNIDFWFSKTTQQKLALLLDYINNIKDISIRNFFKVAFSETVRETSFVKQGEFKLVKNKNKTDKEDWDVFGVMISKLSRNKIGLVELEKQLINDTVTSVHSFNTINGVPHDLIKPESVDIVVTSPPYGDSRTTVAYGQYSRLSNEWLGYGFANQIDKMLMGGEKRKANHVFSSQILNDVVSTIKNEDKERVKDVISFYEDYEKSIRNVSSTLKKGAFACYVVGNRTVKGLNIPTDEITAELFEDNNFVHIETIIRNIPNKRMPLKNSPTNVTGVTASTMKNEYIVISQKQ